MLRNLTLSIRSVEQKCFVTLCLDSKASFRFAILVERASLTHIRGVGER